MSLRKMPKGFGGTTWTNHNVIHPIGVTILIACGITILMQPRERVILPLIFFMLAIPSVQRIVILTLDFSFIRILIMLTLARMMIRGEGRGFKMEKPDVAILYWMVWAIISFYFLRGPSGLITRTGYMLDVVGAYFIGRVYVRSIGDIHRLALTLGMIAIPMLFFFMIERITGKNPFFIFGGVPENTIIRNDRLRCQGPFPHPIMAGVFWAGILPWLGGIWFAKSARRLYVAFYIIAVGLLVINTASSTPIMGVIFCILGLSMFRYRYRMRFIKRMILFLLLSLHLIMKGPVWSLIARIDLSGGSTGEHRYKLIAKSIEHFSEWWKVGIISTGHWGWGLDDITNQYLLEGVRSGFLGMVLFIVFFTRVYGVIGEGIRKVSSKKEQWILWSSGVMLFVHMMSFLAVAYFGQMNIAFFLFVGTIVSIATSAKYTTQIKHE